MEFKTKIINNKFNLRNLLDQNKMFIKNIDFLLIQFSNLFILI